MLEGLMVPFPNKFVSPGEPWQAERRFPLCREGQFSLPDASLLVTYIYLGTRKRNGHDEAVVGFNGQVPGGRAQDAKSGARAEGTAVIDLTSGQISEADAYVVFDSELSNPFAQLGRAYSAKANGSVRVRMRRT